MGKEQTAIEALKRLSSRLNGTFKEGQSAQDFKKIVNKEIDKLIELYGGVSKNQNKINKISGISKAKSLGTIKE